MTLRLAGGPLPTGCLQAQSNQPVQAVALLQSGSVHVTAVQHTSSGQQLICDGTATVPTETLDLDLGEVDPTTIDYYAEFFDSTGKRVASGSLLASTNATASSSAKTLHMFAASSWSCPPSVLNAARAFHSATLLPDGEVLLLGGIEALTADGTDVFGLLDSAEIYDPRSASFLPLSISAGALSGLAFHQTAVIGSSGTKTRLLVYGGVTAPPGQPALFVPNSPTQLRLMPAGAATPAGAQIIDYDSAQRSLAVSVLSVEPHQTALAGGAQLPGGGLVVVGGSTFTQSLPFMRSNPAVLSAVTELATFSGSSTDLTTPPTFAFAAASGMPPWLIGPSVTPLSMTTALVLGAKEPPDAAIAMQSLALTGLPGGAQFPTAQPVGGASTVFHTATRLGPAITAGMASGNAQVLVTGGFEQDTQPPYATRQPPAATDAVRIYNISDAGGSLSPITYSPVTPYMPTGTCGAADGHYRPAGFEAATGTVSGTQVLITGGTPTVPSTGCADCEPTDTEANKLLCVLTQASLYDSTTQMLTAVPSLPLGRLGHQQTRLADGNILVTGGLVRPASTSTQATNEAEVYNPVLAAAAGSDPNNPLAPLLANGPATACPKL